MMDQTVTIPAGRLAYLEERAGKLAREKSEMQLIMHLINRISALPGLDNLITNLLQSIVEVIGGDNLVLYYLADDELFRADLLGDRSRLEQFDDDQVRQVFENNQPLEVAGPFAETRMLTDAFSAAFTWIYPLAVGGEQVGVLKMENLHISMREMYPQFPAFFKYVALLLKNQIEGHSRLKQAYDQLSEMNAELEAEIDERQRAEQALMDARDQLEDTVRERTAELADVNESLKHELAERKAAQRTVALMGFALDTVHEAAFLIDEHACFRYVNEESCRMLGYSRAELLALGVEQVDPDFPQQRWPEHWQELKARQTVTFEGWHRRKDGSIFPVEISANYFEYEGDGLDLALVRDISARKAAEEALRSSEEKLRKAQQVAHIGSWELDLSTNLLSWSDEIYRIFELDPASFSPSYDAFLACIHPDDRETVSQAYEASLANRQPYAVVHRLLMADNRIKYVHEQCESVFADDGTPLRSMGTVQDITERQQVQDALTREHAELQRLNATLEQRVQEEVEKNREQERIISHQARLAAMGEMLSNIAHQWRQPLNNLGLFIQNLRLDYAENVLDEERLTEYVANSLETIQYMSRTISDFQNFFRPNREKIAFVVASAIKEAVQLVEVSLRTKGITISVDATGECHVIGFPNEFSQVLLNIINNARDVLLERAVVNPAIAITCHCKGTEAVVAIRDNAGGIAEELLDKVFDPYFTTKAKTQGTGLGLYMAKMILTRSMGGRMMVHNVSGGAEFVMRIPVTPSLPERQEEGSG